MSTTRFATRAAMSALILVGALAGTVMGQGATSSPTDPSVYRTRPVFVENRGQWDGDFLYKSRVGAMTVFVERTGWTFTIEEHAAKTDPSDQTAAFRTDESRTPRGVAVRMKFAGNGRARAVMPERRSPGVHHYFLGSDATRWQTAIPLFESLRLVDVWPGVDVITRFEGNHFEYDLLVSPGFDLSAAVIEVDGANGLRRDEDGALVIDTPLGPVLQPKPRTWEETATGRVAIDCAFVRLDDRRFGFAAPAWRGDRPLVVDPTLLFSTFTGGTNGEYTYSGAIAPDGSDAFCGFSNSPNYPTTLGAYDPTLNGVGDAFVTSVTPSGAALAYSTFIGGNGSDVAVGMAIDPAGSATIVGGTASSDFPVTAGAYDVSFNLGIDDAFVIRLSPSGNAILYSTFIGGSGDDTTFGVGLHADGSATIIGQTTSPNFPTGITALDQSYNGNVDLFVSKLSPSGGSLVFSTYIGGSAEEYAGAVVITPIDEAVVVGSTRSPNFPTTTSGFDTSHNGLLDAFAFRLSQDGGLLQSSTLIGGVNDDFGKSVALGALGAVYIAGNSASPDFPVTTGAYDVSPNGNQDGFLLCMPQALNGLQYATLFGGADNEMTFDVALDPAGAPTVVGYTSSADFPMSVGGFDSSYGGFDDAFLVQFSPSGSAIYYSTFLGGASGDALVSIAYDGAGAHVFGFTESPEFPATPGAFSTVNSGSYDAFVARLSVGDFSSCLTPAAPPPAGSGLTLWINQAGGPGTLSIENYFGAPGDFFLTTFSFDAVNAGPLAGQGWWGGLWIPFSDFWLQANPLLGRPFNGFLDANGYSWWALVPCGLPAGLPPLYAVTTTFHPATLYPHAFSNLVTIQLY